LQDHDLLVGDEVDESVEVRVAARQERDPIADPYDGIGNVLSTGPGQQSLDLDVGR
jgi:hypothetical protein